MRTKKKKQMIDYTGLLCYTLKVTSYTGIHKRKDV